MGDRNARPWRTFTVPKKAPTWIRDVIQEWNRLAQAMNSMRGVNGVSANVTGRRIVIEGGPTANCNAVEFLRWTQVSQSGQGSGQICAKLQFKRCVPGSGSGEWEDVPPIGSEDGPFLVDGCNNPFDDPPPSGGSGNTGSGSGTSGSGSGIP